MVDPQFGGIALSYYGRAAMEDVARLAASGHLYVMARVGGIRCALPLAAVIETMRLLPVERIAGAPAWILGVSI